MTLKEAIMKKTSKASKTKTDDGEFWEVRIDAEVIEQVHIVEYVKASSKAEAQEAAFKQFKKRTPAIVNSQAMRKWKDENRYSLQHLRTTEIQKRKKPAFSKLQREILKALMEGQHLQRSYSQWVLVDPTTYTDKWGNNYSERSVPKVSVNALFRKGLLIDLVTANMSEQEVEMQTAIGSLPEQKAYTIDKKVVKALGLRL